MIDLQHCIGTQHAAEPICDADRVIADLLVLHSRQMQYGSSGVLQPNSSFEPLVTKDWIADHTYIEISVGADIDAQIRGLGNNGGWLFTPALTIRFDKRSDLR